jgi:hypothetical protein
MKKTIAITASPTILILMVTFIGVLVMFSKRAEFPQLVGTTKDETLNGCVDCHKSRPEIGRDFRLNLALKSKGNHSNAATIADGEIPIVCKICHSNELFNRVHLIHLTGSLYEENITNRFLANYQEQCLYCHSLDVSTGEMTIKTGYEASP